MAIGGYGVLAGTAVGAKRAGKVGKPHYQIQIMVEGACHRVAVNVMSRPEPAGSSH